MCTCKSERDFLFSKLDEVEQTFKEMNEKLADPDVVGNPTEFQKLAKSVSDIQPLIDARQEHRSLTKQVAEAKGGVNGNYLAKGRLKYSKTESAAAVEICTWLPAYVKTFIENI